MGRTTTTAEHAHEEMFVVLHIKHHLSPEAMKFLSDKMDEISKALPGRPKAIVGPCGARLSFHSARPTSAAECDLEAQQREWGEMMEATAEADRERARRRDTFAAAALSGLVSLNAPGPHQRMPDEIIQSAWRWSDAMLEAATQTGRE